MEDEVEIFLPPKRCGVIDSVHQTFSLLSVCPSHLLYLTDTTLILLSHVWIKHSSIPYLNIEEQQHYYFRSP